MANSNTTFTPHPLGDKLWKELQTLNSEDVCHKASVLFDQGVYTVVFMNEKYRVYVDKEQIEGPNSEPLQVDSELQLLLLTYLSSAQDAFFGGKWISENDLQGGELFFKGPHTLPTAPLIERFGKDPEKFVEIGAALGGAKVAEYGDIAWEFMALPKIPIVCVLWAEDEEFPARVSFLFDPSIESYLPLDVVLALVRSVVNRLLESE